MDGIVLAGARAPQDLAELGIARVPLLKVRGETILERTCQALLGAGCETVYVLAPEEVPLPELPGVSRGAYSGDVIRDMFNCLERESGADSLVGSSADMPLVNAAAMLELVKAGVLTGADIVYPAVERAALEKVFPGTKRTYVRLGRQTVTGGNAVWLNRKWLLKHQDQIWQLFAKRKSIKELAKFFGIMFFVRILTGFASVDYVERHLSWLLDGKLKAVVLSGIELGMDLDKTADLVSLRDYIDPWNGSAGGGA